MKVSLASIVLMTLAVCTASGALPPDPRLLSLVPPGSQIVAGTAAPLSDSHRGHFLIFTRANTLDVEDFFSLMGADPSLEVRQVIFAASAETSGASPEHSLLVIGHFDANRLHRSARTSSIAKKYHGVGLLIVHPFERERAILSQDRMLAIVNSSLVIFGTPSSVEEEIDRYLSRAAADASIMQKLNQLRNQDETWCLISPLPVDSQIPRVLWSLDPVFGEIDANSESLLFGIKYGRQIEFEYITNTRPVLQAVPPSSHSFDRMFSSAGSSLSLASNSSAQPGDRRVVKVSKARYERWLATLTQH